MKTSTAGFLLVLGFCAAANAAVAASIDVTVDGRSGPWDQGVNPGLTYDTAALAPTVVRSTTGLLAAGTAYTISFAGGETQTVSFYGKTDGIGYMNINQYDNSVPAQYAFNKTSANLQSLLGAFADSTGKVIDQPFVVGNSISAIAPQGASEIVLGINDNHYADNLGALTVSVSGANISAVPLPGAAPLFGAALLGLGAAGYGFKRRRAATAA